MSGGTTTQASKRNRANDLENAPQSQTRENRKYSRVRAPNYEPEEHAFEPQELVQPHKLEDRNVEAEFYGEHLREPQEFGNRDAECESYDETRLQSPSQPSKYERDVLPSLSKNFWDPAGDEWSNMLAPIVAFNRISPGLAGRKQRPPPDAHFVTPEGSLVTIPGYYHAAYGPLEGSVGMLEEDDAEFEGFQESEEPEEPELWSFGNECYGILLENHLDEDGDMSERCTFKTA